MAAMIDWLSGDFACPNDGMVYGGFLSAYHADGSRDWTSFRRLQVEGSHSAVVSVKSRDYDTLTVSGNPSKFLQGHNVFGSNNLLSLAPALLEGLTDRLGLSPSPSARASWYAGEFDLSRLDLTRSYDLGSADQVRRFLTAAGAVAHGRHQKVSQYDSQTVYLGQKSRRASLKLYDKFTEMQQRGHTLPTTLAPIWHQKLLQWAEGKVRAEVTLRSMELRDRHLDRGAVWSPSLIESVIDNRLAQLELNDTMRLAEDAVIGLRPKLVPIYHAWRAGADLKSLYAKNTFYRYRRALLPHGIDIAHVRPHEVIAENQYLLGQPLKSFLTGPGVEPPAWARGTDLLAS
jgi:II/X family phage/plasmid replication protein